MPGYLSSFISHSGRDRREQPTRGHAASDITPRSTESAAPGLRRSPARAHCNGLWDRYRDLSAWAQLSMATRRQRENIMAGVLEEASAMPISGTDQKGHCRRARGSQGHASPRRTILSSSCVALQVGGGRRALSHPTPARDVGMLKVKTAGIPVLDGGRHRPV